MSDVADHALRNANLVFGGDAAASLNLSSVLALIGQSDLDSASRWRFGNWLRATKPVDDTDVSVVAALSQVVGGAEGPLQRTSTSPRSPEVPASFGCALASLWVGVAGDAVFTVGELLAGSSRAS